MTTSTPDLSAMIAPGQEGLLEEFLAGDTGAPVEAPQGGDELHQFLAEQEKQDTPPVDDGIPEKFKGKSAAEIAKAYQELEKKLGERPEPAGPDPATYTPELGVEIYGETIAAAIAAAEINPLEMAAMMQRGEDVSDYSKALVEKGGIPQALLDTYLAGVAPKPAAAPEASTLTDADVGELQGLVGGADGFNKLSQWAVANLPPDELADYNAAVDSGNKAVVRLALRSMQARQAATGTREPKLIGGRTLGPTGPTFETRADWEKARYSQKYEQDPKFRREVDQGLLRAEWS